MKKLLWITTGDLLNLKGYGLRVLKAKYLIDQSFPLSKHIIYDFENFKSYLNNKYRINLIKGRFDKSFFSMLLPNRYMVLYICNIILTIIKLIAVILLSRPNFVYCHGTRAGIPLAILKKLRFKVSLVTDVHGVVSEEVIALGIYNRNSLFHKLDRYLEKMVITSSNKVIYVSEKMKNYYKLYNDEAFTIPCFYDEKIFYFDESNREEIRDKLNFKDKIVFVYSGSTLPWQKIEETFKIFAEIKKIEKKAFLLVLSGTDREFFYDFAEKYFIDKNDIYISSLEQNQMKKFLSASDFAFMLRDENLLNDVSSPTKFCEYLACGLPVIISKGVGDFTELVRKNNIGIVVDDFRINEDELVLLINSDRTVLRGKCISIANDNYRSSNYLHIYTRIFNNEKP